MWQPATRCSGSSCWLSTPSANSSAAAWAKTSQKPQAANTCSCPKPAIKRSQRLPWMRSATSNSEPQNQPYQNLNTSFSYISPNNRIHLLHQINEITMSLPTLLESSEPQQIKTNATLPSLGRDVRTKKHQNAKAALKETEYQQPLKTKTSCKSY